MAERKSPYFRKFINMLAGMTLGAWALLLILVSLLVFSIVIGYFGWTSAPDTVVPASGYVAMAIGIVFSIVIGSGLMALVFYSSRLGYDEPAKPEEDDTPAKS